MLTFCFIVEKIQFFKKLFFHFKRRSPFSATGSTTNLTLFNTQITILYICTHDGDFYTCHISRKQFLYLNNITFLDPSTDFFENLYIRSFPQIVWLIDFIYTILVSYFILHLKAKNHILEINFQPQPYAVFLWTYGSFYLPRYHNCLHS